MALDATQPWGNGRLLPAGWLREPASALGRAHAVILTRCEGPETVSHAAASIHDRHPRLAVYRSRHLPVRLHFPADPPRPPLRPEELKGRAVGAFAGLARPDSLRLSLESMGAQVVMFRPLPDHQPFAPGQVKGFLQEAQAAGAELLVTSAKDLARMPPGEVPAELAVLDITLQVEEEAELLALLRRLCGRPALPWETDDGRVEPSP